MFRPWYLEEKQTTCLSSLAFQVKNIMQNVCAAFKRSGCFRLSLSAQGKQLFAFAKAYTPINFGLITSLDQLMTVG